MRTSRRRHPTPGTCRFERQCRHHALFRNSRARIANMLYSYMKHHSNERRLATDMGKKLPNFPLMPQHVAYCSTTSHHLTAMEAEKKREVQGGFPSIVGITVHLHPRGFQGPVSSVSYMTALHSKQLHSKLKQQPLPSALPPLLLTFAVSQCLNLMLSAPVTSVTTAVSETPRTG